MQDIVKQFERWILDINPCTSAPCTNNGTCSRIGYTQDFVCDCLPGYTGLQCQTGKISHLPSVNYNKQPYKYRNNWDLLNLPFQRINKCATPSEL
jgi:hypothetical protein